MGDAPVLIPDAGPWITLAYADGLDLLLKPGWPLAMVDMVLEELTRSHTPTSQQIAAWVTDQQIPVLSTEVCRRAAGRRQRHLGEMAIQETMQAMAMEQPPRRGVFLFEDHKIARATFLLPPGCLKVTTRAWLLFLEREGWLDSAVAIERRAIEAGRQFSRLRFPLD
ncbi:hypothetical protein [Synechococcus sp. 8F6]|uniref:hypothetical protein n=1 Tax=Synechococcus sp. 8F6 TaxID=2025606 RepID=UPI000B9969C3|nr:hypothetical protein [Synechococcus sp. 8F6]